MQASNPAKTSDAPKDFRKEFGEYWNRLPTKGVFITLLMAWLGFFHFLGNSTLGIMNTSSLIEWIGRVYWTGGATGKESWSERILGLDNSYCWFVLPAVLVLFWWKREKLDVLPKNPWWPAALLLGFSVLIHIVGFMIQQPLLSMVGFILGGHALIGMVWGWPMMRSTAFPYYLLFFAMPVAYHIETISLPLRLLATKISVGICHTALGIDVVRQGTSIWEPTGKYQYEVAAACSGIRSLAAFIALSTFYGVVRFTKAWKRSLIVLLAIPLAVTANVIRLLMIIIAAESFGQHAGNWVHESSWMSLLPYVPLMILLFIIGYWLKEDVSDEEKKETKGNIQEKSNA